MAGMSPAAAKGEGLTVGFGSTKADFDQSGSGGMGSREKVRRRSGLNWY